MGYGALSGSGGGGGSSLSSMFTGGSNFDQMFNQLGSSVDTMSNNLQGIISGMDPNDPASVMKVQQALQQYNIVMQLESNTVKSIGDTIKNTISNVR